MVETYTKEELEVFIKDCVTKADLCRKLGLNPTGGNYRTVDNLIKKFNLDFSHYEGRSWKKGKHVLGVRYNDVSEVLIENSKYKTTNHLKERLFAEHIKQKVCEVCGITNDEVTLELHHINGDPTDNRLENLQILCPNCHSKTENFRGKNKTRCRTHMSRQEFTITEEEAELRRQEKNAKRRKHVEKKPTIMDKIQICEHCGKEFHARRIQKHCSIECYQAETKGSRPTLMVLINDFKELKSFVQVGNKYGVTDNAVRKWCRLYGIPDKSKDMQNFVKNF